MHQKFVSLQIAAQVGFELKLANFNVSLYTFDSASSASQNAINMESWAMPSMLKPRSSASMNKRILKPVMVSSRVAFISRAPRGGGGVEDFFSELTTWINSMVVDPSAKNAKGCFEHATTRQLRLRISERAHPQVVLIPSCPSPRCSGSANPLQVLLAVLMEGSYPALSAEFLVAAPGLQAPNWYAAALHLSRHSTGPVPAVPAK